MRLFKGGANIDITFKRGDGVLQFKPGETLAGKVRVEAEHPITCRDVLIEVGWHTEGKGDRNSERVLMEPLMVTELLPDQPVTHPFSFTLPHRPYTYQGELIRIVWEVTVKVDIAMMPDMTESRSFVLRP